MKPMFKPLRASLRLKLTLLLPWMTLLSGCETAGSCSLLPLKEYDAAFTAKITAELQAAPRDAAWPQYLVDQTALRDAVRACRGSK